MCAKKYFTWIVSVILQNNPAIQYGQFNDCSANTWDGVFVTASLAGLQTVGRKWLWWEQRPNCACLAWLGSCPSACPEQRLLGVVFGPKTMRADPNQTTTSTTAPQPVRTLRSETKKYVLSQGIFCPPTFHNTCFITHYGGNSWLIQIGTIIVSIISCLGVGPREMESLA